MASVNEHDEPQLPEHLPESPPPLAAPERRAQPRVSRLPMRLIGVLVVVGLGIAFAGWWATNQRADKLAKAVCAMADAFTDAKVQDRRIADTVADLNARFDAGIAVLLRDDPDAAAKLRATIEEQNRQAQAAARRPPLPAEVRAAGCD